MCIKLIYSELIIMAFIQICAEFCILEFEKHSKMVALFK